MLKDSNLGELCLPGSSAHKGAKMSMEEVKEAAAKPRRKKKKLKKGWIVLAVVILVAAGFFLLRKKGGNTQAVLASDTQVLEYADLESSISATGTVESSDTTMEVFP